MLSTSFFYRYLFYLIGQSLVESGESFKHLAEIKYNLEDNVRQNFIEPLTQTQNKDLKEVNVSIPKSIIYQNWLFNVHLDLNQSQFIDGLEIFKEYMKCVE